MNRNINILAALLVVIGAGLFAPHAAAQSDSAGARQDLTTFNRLAEQLRRLDVDYDKALEDATAEARTGGSGPGPAQARLLSIRDQRDRAMDRLVLLSVRHGWALPGEDAAGGGTTAAGPQSEKERIFFGARLAVQGRLAEEARAAARSMRLPMLSVETIQGGG